MMWGTLLAVALWVSLDPTRLVIGGVSRPRLRHNLFAYWVSGLAAGIAPGFAAFALLGNSLPAVMEGMRSTVATRRRRLSNRPH